mgnify:CR=1 FL=1
MKQKVMAYILRQNNTQTEILVFDHLKYPEVSPQVIAGSVEVGEKPIAAANREVFEEAGLEFSQFHYKLGEFEYFREDIQEKQLTTLGQNIKALEVQGVFDVIKANNIYRKEYELDDREKEQKVSYA